MSLETLVKLAKHFDPRATPKLLEIIEPWVTVVCASLLELPDREDMVQEVCAAFFIGIGNFIYESEPELRSYTKRMSRNLCLNFISRKKKMEIEEFVQDDYNDPVQDETGSYHEMQYQDLLTALSKIPFHYRTVLTLVEIERMSYTEISEHLGIPEGTLRSHYCRGTRLLKKILIKKGFYYGK